MFDKCQKCSRPNTDDCLVDGLCFDCSTDTPAHVDLQKPIRETIDNIVETFAVRTGELKSKVRKDWSKAVKDGGQN